MNYSINIPITVSFIKIRKTKEYKTKLSKMYKGTKYKFSPGIQ